MEGYHDRVVVAVDDNMINLRTLELSLSPHFEVHVAKSGPTALVLVDSMPRVDLLLLDIEMPGMDGITLLEELRKNERIRDTPVVFVTSRQNTEMVLTAKQLGAVSYIKKPYTIPVLLTKVFAALGITDRYVDPRGEVRVKV